MSPQEAQAWKNHTAASAHAWTADPCHSTADDLLIHKGGESGAYVMVRGPVLTIGTYEGALPHIGEASFKIQGRKTFRDNETALKFMIERGGVDFLKAYLLGGA